MEPRLFWEHSKGVGKEMKGTCLGREGSLAGWWIKQDFKVKKRDKLSHG